VFALLGVVSIAYARRGAEDSLRARTRLMRQRAHRLLPAGALLSLAVIGCGGWYFYNAHVLNDYRTADDRRQQAAFYEREFKKYQYLPQAKVTAVDTTVDIYPERRAFAAAGRFTLQNKTAQSISEVHLTDRHNDVREIKFDRPFHLVRKAPEDLYAIYAFESPLEPGDVVNMEFKVSVESHGFRDGNELAQLAYNGTFFDTEFLPEVGYDASVEIDDPRRRRELKLGAQIELPERGDATGSQLNLFTTTSDWITYHAVVSTSADQTAIAPGYLLKRWTQDGRNYFEYSMGSTHILDFFAYLSAHYDLRREVYQGKQGPINLEVYYDPAHTFDIDAMLDSSRAGLSYFESHFSPFQFRQFRIMEYPRYRTFAQSFPNTVPFSEGIGFISRMEDPKRDVDLTYFVTAHELGHQWWGHQLVGAQVEGSNMMSETLAQYSAYMVMQHKYGKDYMHRVMHHYLDRYLRGRAGEVRRERPLALVQNEPYVWYEKGGQIMYTLADYIGEEKIDLALHRFLEQYHWTNSANQQDAVGHATGQAALDQVYPDTRMLVEALKEQTPPEYQYLIEDGFNHIILYDNKVRSAKSHRRSDGKYEVTLEVEARKSEADGNGAESPRPLNDYIEVGVFNGRKDEEHALYLQKERITQEHNTFTVVVDSKPTRAGFDPYNKLIDRIADDNMIDVDEL
jgi:aminopeptidase N